MKKWTKTLFIFLALCLAYTCVDADDKIELTLNDAISYAVKQNLSLSGEKLNPKIAEANIEFKQGEFDPAVELKGTESYNKYFPPTTITGTNERSYKGDISIGGKAITGTAYELKWTNERTRSNSYYLRMNPYYNSEVIFSLKQPVLKGFGMDVQESQINIAKNSLEISNLDLDDKTIALISDTTKAYWDLAFARHDIEVAEFSLKLANGFLAEISAKIKLGYLAPVEIYKAEAEVFVREEALIKAKKTALDAEDKLRVIINLEKWESEIVPISQAPEPSDIQPVVSALHEAHKNRKDYKQALIECKNKEILKNFYDNQRYPDVNIIGSVGTNGLSDTYKNALDKMKSRDYYSWEFGLSIKIPLGNNEAGGKYKMARYDKEKSEIAVKTLEQKIAVEVREAWRSVQVFSETIKASKKTKIAAEKRLAAETGKFKIGMSTINDVLKFQEEYAKALSSEKKAETDYAKAVIELERVKGTLGDNFIKNDSSTQAKLYK